MDLIGTDIPFGTPVLHTLFDEFLDEKSPFNLQRIYKANRQLGYISFLGGYVPKYLHVNGVEIMENMSLRDFNKIIETFPKEIIENPDYDLIIPLAIRCDYMFSSILGHFTAAIVKKRNNYVYVEIYDSKKEDMTGKFSQIVSLFEECDLDVCECKLYYCATQKTEDIVNCGYYMFKVIYNYLLLTKDHDKEDKIFAVNSEPGQRDVSEMIMRILTGEMTSPYSYENIIVGDHTINYLTLKERNYLYECVKKERLRSQGLLV